MASNRPSPAKGKGAKQQTPPPLPTPPPAVVEADMEPEEVSILNFPKDSKKVFITELASNEALKRCGLSAVDLGFVPLIEFKRPGCDNTVTNLLFQKHEEKRQHYIAEVSLMRQKVLEEIKSDEESKVKARMEAKAQKSNCEAVKSIKDDRSDSLKKFVVKQLRDIFARQFHFASVQKTLARSAEFSEIQRLKTESSRPKSSISVSRQTRPQTPVQSSLPPINQKEDKSVEQMAKLSEERAKSAQLFETKMQQGKERYLQRMQQQIEERSKKISNEETRFGKWEEERLQKENEETEKRKARKEKAYEVLRKKKDLEEENRNHKLKKIAETEAKEKDAAEAYRKQLNESFESKRALLTTRLQKAEELRQKQAADTEEQRMKIFGKGEDVERRKMEIEKEKTLKLIEQKLIRDEKAESIRRKAEAEAYLRMKEEKKAETQTKNANSTISREKRDADVQFEKSRDLLLSTFRCMEGIDERAINSIRNILGIDKAEMEQLVQVARKPIDELKKAKPQKCE